MKVAIFGAGLSGLTCAKILKEAGINVSIFEKSGHPSGRLSRKVVNDDFVDNGAQYFTARHPDFIGQVDKWLASGVASVWSSSMGKLVNGSLISSSDDIVRFVGTPTMDSIGNKLSEGLDIRFNTEIKYFTTVTGLHNVFDTENVALGEFDWIIFAIPAEQTNVIIRNSKCKSKALVEKEGFEDMHDPCWSVRLTFTSPLPFNFEGVFCDDPVLKWVAYDSSKPKRNHNEHHYIIHTTPGWTNRNLELAASDISHLVCDYFLGLIDTQLQPTSMNAHRWRYAIPKKQGHSKQYINHQQKIAIAGDWTLGGKIENAYLSGKSTAECLLDGHFMTTTADSDTA